MELVAKRGLADCDDMTKAWEKWQLLKNSH